MIFVPNLLWINKPSAKGAACQVVGNFNADIALRVKLSGGINDRPVTARTVAVDNTANVNGVTVTINGIGTLISANTRLNVYLAEDTSYIDATAIGGLTNFNFYENIADAPPDQPNYSAIIQATTAAARLNSGSCILKLTGGNLVLTPRDGNAIMINGVTQLIPAVGVALGPAAFGVGALTYVYAFMNAGVMTLEGSVAGHTTDPTTGIEIKIGDVTRTLVGMARAVAGPLFVDTPAQRFVASYFNRRVRSLRSAAYGGENTISAVFIEANAAKRVEFLIWGADDEIYLGATGAANQIVTPNSAMISIAIDGAVVGDFTESQTTGAAYAQAHCPSIVAPVTEGYHFGSLFFAATGASATTIAHMILGGMLPI